MIRLGITGTDTAVGKTFLTVLLLDLLRRSGRTVSAMKPVETGVRADDPRSDAMRLRDAAGGEDPIEHVRPLLLAEPLSPWVALSRSGGRLDLAALDAAFEALAEGRDAVIVEGAGGLLVPLTRELAYQELFARWGLELVIVAGNRLGALNHTLLTVRAARSGGLPVRGVILNALGPGRAGIAERTNQEALAELLDPIPVLAFPWIARNRSRAYAVEIAEENGFGRLIGAAPEPPPPG
jgi:dethiobiotin synthetase